MLAAAGEALVGPSEAAEVVEAAVVGSAAIGGTEQVAEVPGLAEKVFGLV
jgi:hypothetical protein